MPKVAKGSANIRQISSRKIRGKAGGRETQKTTGMQTREARGKEMLQEAEDSLTVRYVEFLSEKLGLGADSFVISEHEFCQLSSTFFSLYRSRQFLQRRSPTPQATKRPDPARVLPFVCSFGLRPEMPRLVALTRRLLSVFCLVMWTTGPRKDATPGIRLCSGFGNMRVWQDTVAMKKSESTLLTTSAVTPLLRFVGILSSQTAT